MTPRTLYQIIRYHSHQTDEKGLDAARQTLGERVHHVHEDVSLLAGADTYGKLMCLFG